MSISQGSLVLRDKLIREYSSVEIESNESHTSMASSFSSANILYNISSIMEDIVLNEYLSLINTTNTIGPSGFLNKGVIMESFTSTDYLDGDFPVDSKLNLDTQNGHLTLPIESTRDLKVTDLIFETASNGQAGSSIDGFKNNKPNAIIDGSANTLFEYESFSNIFNNHELKLGITLKLEKEEIANGIYIKTHVVQDLKYPKIAQVQISLNGEEWEDALGIMDINKGDHYIRFIPKKIRYVRIKFTQDTFYNIKTLFGYKRRYLIGVRQITIKQTKYNPNGEYVSKSFSGKKTINRISFSSSQIDNKDIKYLVSANNGSKWNEIKSGETVVLDNNVFGLDPGLHIKSIRIKVKMDRNASPGTSSRTERIGIGSSSKYTLEYIPVEIKSYLGKHISFGEEKLYNLNMLSSDDVDPSILEDFACSAESLKNIIPIHWVPYYEGIQKDLIVRFNGMLVKNNDTVYSILPHTNKKHSLMVIYKDYLIGGTVSLNFKPYLHSHQNNDDNIITLPMPMITDNEGSIIIQSIIYEDYESILFHTATDNDVDIVNIFDGDSSTFWRADTKSGDTGNSWDIDFTLGESKNIKMYSITPVAIDNGDETPLFQYAPRAWQLLGSNDGTTWRLVDERSVEYSIWANDLPADFLIDVPCKYSMFKLVISDNNVETPSTICAIGALKLFTSYSEVLDPKKDYVIMDRSSIKLSQEKYSPDWDYEISYLPGVDFDDYIITKSGSKEVLIDNIADTSYDNDIVFDYTHEDASSIQNVKYYTPISKEYRVELL